MPSDRRKQPLTRCETCVYAVRSNSAQWSCAFCDKLITSETLACDAYEKRVRKKTEPKRSVKHGKHLDKYSATIYGHCLDRYCAICRHFVCAEGTDVGSCDEHHAEAHRRDRACDRFLRDNNAETELPNELGSFENFSIIY